MKLAFHIMLNIVTKINCQRSNQPFNIQSFFGFWDKFLYVCLETNKGRCGWQLKFATNIIWNEELDLFWMSQIQDFKLYQMYNYFKPFSFNNQYYTSIIGCNLTSKETWNMNLWFWMISITMNITCWTKWWHLLHENFHTFWNGSVIGLLMDNNLIIQFFF